MFKKIKIKIAVALRNFTIKKCIKHADDMKYIYAKNKKNPQRIIAIVYKFHNVAIKITPEAHTVTWGRWQDKKPYFNSEFGIIASGDDALFIDTYAWNLVLKQQRKAAKKEDYKNKKIEIKNMSKMVESLVDDIRAGKE